MFPITSKIYSILIGVAVLFATFFVPTISFAGYPASEIYRISINGGATTTNSLVVNIYASINPSKALSSSSPNQWVCLPYAGSSGPGDEFEIYFSNTGTSDWVLINPSCSGGQSKYVWDLSKYGGNGAEGVKTVYIRDNGTFGVLHTMQRSIVYEKPKPIPAPAPTPAPTPAPAPAPEPTPQPTTQNNTYVAPKTTSQPTTDTTQNTEQKADASTNAKKVANNKDVQPEVKGVQDTRFNWMIIIYILIGLLLISFGFISNKIWLKLKSKKNKK